MTTSLKETDLERVNDLGRRIAEILAGNPPAIQGAVLADLLSMWCAGHQSADREALEDYREELIEKFIKQVRALIPINEKAILEGIKTLDMRPN